MFTFYEEVRNKIAKLSLFDLFILFSPIIDLITSFSIRYFNLSVTFGMIIRSCFLLYMLYYFFFKIKSEYKKISLIYLLILFLYCFLHLFNIYFLKGLSVFISEFKILIKMFYFPIILVVIFNHFSISKNKMSKNLFHNVSIMYLFLIVIAIITNTSFQTYTYVKNGFTGWFFSPNEISAILSMLSPFIIIKIMKNYKKLYVYICLYLYTYIMLLIGTKVPFLGILLSILGYLFVYGARFILDKENRPRFIKFVKIPVILPIIISVAIVIFLYKGSTLYYNMAQHKKIIIEQYKEDGQQNNQDMILKKRDYINLIFSGRENFNSIMYKKFIQANTKEQLFGLGYIDIENKFNRQYNIVEIDYADIFYLYGIYGFVVYFIMFVIMLIDIIILSIKRFKTIIFNDSIIPYYISIVLMLGIALFAGRSFTAPAVSIYPAIIIPLLYLEINKESDEKHKTLLEMINEFLKIHYIKVLFIVSLIFILSFVILF